ncbi:uncharacterized protein LOC123680566 [Harmonia axyridis]|uniref:uncharacterized protein LOC123680566 n=1 Tax=Harmonia axyridis TaxID=115357 RepID=UPI001E278AD8|nr:uncharacterized protein LOC123680566 [Harmonia axyridis]
MNQQSDNLICNVCQKSYSSVSAKNRHLRTVHHEAVEEKPKNTVHLQCPICNEQEKPSFGSHDLLISHLENNHSLSIKTSFYKFRTMEEFETWRALISRSVDYVVNSTHITQSTNTKRIYYNCNRSNYRGFVSQCSQRSMKKGGSIRISGMCPSRICLKICGSEITVKFIETHVGHGDDLRAKHLTQSEQQEIAKKLNAGVTKERILQDSRAISDHQIERKNLLNCGDLAYIIKKFNIDNIENEERQNPNVSTDHSRKQGITKERAHMLVNMLNDDNLDKFIRIMEKLVSEQTEGASTSKKRKIDKQSYYPSKK